MKNLLQIIIGLIIISIIGYTLVISILIFTGNTDKTFDDIWFQLVVSSIFIIIFIVGFVKDRTSAKSIQTNTKKANKNITTKKEHKFNPEFDKLHYGIYEQSSKTWWSDSDGDSHSRETVYANLRFYEDGTVIGIRQQSVLKKENPGSFVYKGTYMLSGNKIEFTLDKVVDTDDTVFHYITPEEQRDMKFAGHIANDDDLIKAGTYKGLIIGSSLQIGKYEFNLITPNRLIITASESACDSLEKQFKNHPLVLGSFTHSGNWYTNGETGPEWYTVTFESRYELREELEKALKNSSTDFYNMHWG